ncbi:MAG TPA: type II toxin-antitoxin system PemK/MazF family toxin [Tepidisphaeraceae bacterium]|jgi:mRNA interferase MazF
MNPGEIVLIRLQVTGATAPKLRPALLLAHLPGSYQNLLFCGISTRLQELTPQWDELMNAGDSDFGQSGLRQPSAIRLSYLYAATNSEVAGSIGSISSARLQRLRERLIHQLQL